MIQKPYVPLIKIGGFNPNPVAGNIPLFADSITNPKVVGTRAYEEFWDEQFDRCINGYDTGGVHIPGRYYHFLNFKVLRGLKGPQFPFFVDLDLEYYQTVDLIKLQRKTGLISVKARRKGLSEFADNILSHGLRFIDGYRGAVTAGLDTYVTGLRKKFEYTQSSIVKDLRLNVLENNDKVYRVGYEVKNEIGGYVEEGYGGFISFETMQDDATKLEGEYFFDVICEESGRYKRLGAVVSSIEPALEFGSQKLGTFYIFGTGGNILSTSKDFKEYWDNADSFGLVKLWIPGNRKYYPFYGNNKEDFFIDIDNGDKIDSIPNLRHLTKEQRLGCEDTEAAKAYILKKRIEYAKLPNKKKLKELNQNYPLTIEEAFTSGGSNNFNDEKIYDRLFAIEGAPLYKPYILDWVNNSLDDSIARSVASPEEITGLKVKYRPAKPNDPQGNVVWVYQFPMPEMTDLDIGGIDGYNQDLTQTTSSLGAMTVVRQGNLVNLEGMGIHKGRYPVCLYYQRPPTKEGFFDNCLKIAVWYKLIRNVMINAEQDFVIDYFMKNNGARYVSPRPRSFDAPKTQQVHKWGAKMTGFSKGMILGVVQTDVENYVHLNPFPQMLRDMLAYDEEYIGTDWDSVDALAYAIMRCEDMRTRPRKSDDEEIRDEVEWVKDANGNMIIKYIPPSKTDSPISVIKKVEESGKWVELDYKPKRE